METSKLNSAYQLCIAHIVLSGIMISYALLKKYKITFIMWSISLGIGIANLQLILNLKKNKDKDSKTSLILSIVHAIISFVMMFVTLKKGRKDESFIWLASLALCIAKIIILK